jgi:hypothetical protein
MSSLRPAAHQLASLNVRMSECPESDQGSTTGENCSDKIWPYALRLGRCLQDPGAFAGTKLLFNPGAVMLGRCYLAQNRN